MVNKGQIDFNEVLKIRSKAQRFRQWLQSEADRDRDAIIAYHEEVAKESGITKAGRKSLKLFGVLGGGAVGGALVGTAMGNPAIGATIGGAVGSGLTYILDVASKIGTEWKPVVFGNWYKARIAKLLSEKDDKPFTTLDI